MDIQEKQFQEIYLSMGGKKSELEKEDGEYTHSKSQMAWEIWQAAKASVNATSQIDLAVQQLIGFSSAKDGVRIGDLAASMGLKNKEWETIKIQEENILSDEYSEELDEFFSKAQEQK